MNSSSYNSIGEQSFLSVMENSVCTSTPIRPTERADSGHCNFGNVSIIHETHDVIEGYVEDKLNMSTTCCSGPEFNPRPFVRRINYRRKQFRERCYGFQKKRYSLRHNQSQILRCWKKSSVNLSRRRLCPTSDPVFRPSSVKLGIGPSSTSFQYRHCKIKMSTLIPNKYNADCTIKNSDKAYTERNTNTHCRFKCSPPFATADEYDVISGKPPTVPRRRHHRSVRRASNLQPRHTRRGSVIFPLGICCNNRFSSILTNGLLLCRGSLFKTYMKSGHKRTFC